MRMKKEWSDKRELQFLINNVSRMERSNSAKALLLLALLVGQPASTTVSTVSGHQSDSTKSFRKLVLGRWCDDRAVSYIHQTPLRVLYRIGSRSIIALGSVEVWWTRDQAYIRARMARLISSSIDGLCAVTRRVINLIFIQIIGGKSVFIL